MIRMVLQNGTPIRTRCIPYYLYRQRKTLYDCVSSGGNKSFYKFSEVETKHMGKTLY